MEKGNTDISSPSGKHPLNPAFYRACQKEDWQGRIDGEGAEHLRWHQVIRTIDLNIDPLSLRAATDHPFVLLGFACDEGVRRNLGRIGAKDGPQAMRKALSNLPIHHAGLQLRDAGDVLCPDGQLEAAQEQLGLAISKILTQGGFPIVLGGGHEVTYGHYLGHNLYLHENSPACLSTFGIINFDAHFDNREPGENGPSSGTGFWQIEQDLKNLHPDGPAQTNGTSRSAFHYLAIGIQQTGNTKALFDRAAHSGTQYIPAGEFSEKNQEQNTKALKEFLSKIENLYLTIDLDVFASAYAPGVSAPTALGLIPDSYFFSVLNLILQSGKLRSVDFAELNPSLDQDQRTARLAAALISHIVNQLLKED